MLAAWRGEEVAMAPVPRSLLSTTDGAWVVLGTSDTLSGVSDQKVRAWLPGWTLGNAPSNAAAQRAPGGGGGCCRRPRDCALQSVRRRLERTNQAPAQPPVLPARQPQAATQEESCGCQLRSAQSPPGSAPWEHETIRRALLAGPALSQGDPPHRSLGAGLGYTSTASISPAAVARIPMGCTSMGQAQQPYLWVLPPAPNRPPGRSWW